MKNKSVRLLITTVWLTIFLSVVSHQHVEAQVDRYPIVTHGKNKVIGGVVLVMFSSAHTLEEAQLILPDGYEAIQQVLDPQRTELFKDNRHSISTKHSNLTSAEDKLTRSFVVQYSTPYHPSQAALL